MEPFLRLERGAITGSSLSAGSGTISTTGNITENKIFQSYTTFTRGQIGSIENVFFNSNGTGKTVVSGPQKGGNVFLVYINGGAANDFGTSAWGFFV